MVVVVVARRCESLRLSVSQHLVGYYMVPASTSLTLLRLQPIDDQNVTPEAMPLMGDFKDRFSRQFQLKFGIQKVSSLIREEKKSGVSTDKRST